MADQVTISTFLELRDNLSEGLRRVADAIAAATTGAPAAQAAINNIAKTAEDASRKMRRVKSAEEREAEKEAKNNERREARLRKLHEQAEARNARYMRQAAEAFSRMEAMKQAQADRAAKIAADRDDREFQRKLRIYNREINATKREYERALNQRAMYDEKFAMSIMRINRKIAAEREKAERIAKAAAVREANAAIREAERAMNKKIAADKKAADSKLRESRRGEREVERAAKAEARAAERAARAKQRAEAKAASERPSRLFGTMLSADLVSDFVTRGIPRAFGALKDHLQKVAAEGKEYEDSVNRIALSLAGLNISPSMRAATTEAEGLYGVLREMAAKLPGETQDYIRVYAQGLPDALTAGMKDTKKFAEFVSKYTAIAISRGVGSARAATDIEQILEGRARVTTRTYAELRPYIGMLAKDFNKLSPVERFERLQRAVEKAATGIGGIATSANAVFGEMESHIKEIYTIGEKPVFDVIKKSVSELNDLFVKNRSEIMRTVNIVATNLADAFRGLVPIIVSVSKGISELVDYIEQSPVIKGILNFVTFQAIDRGATARREEEAIKERERIAANRGIVQIYKSLLPGTSGLMPEELDQYLMELWLRRQGTKGAMPGAIQSKEDWDAFVTAVSGSAEKAQELWSRLIASGDVETMKMPDHRDIPADRATSYNDFRNSNFNIKQEFAEGFDPDRIAMAFSNDLARLADMKLQAAYSLTGGVR